MVFPLAVPFVVPAVSAASAAAASAVVAIWPIRSARAKQHEAEETARKMATLIALSKASESGDNARIAQNRLEELQHVTAEVHRKAEEERLTVERKWFEGVCPECRPSDEDISRMKAQYTYRQGFIHIAVVGSAGVGRSSFINAVRGMSRKDPVAAPTGIVEITDTVTRYADPRSDSHMVWYDVPGSGTPQVPDWQYFNDKGLYIFDCIIVLTDNRVLGSDLAIFRACQKFRNIEAFIVRSKSDQHINNMVCERMPQGFDLSDPDMDDQTRSLFLQTKLEEQKRFIDETCQNVRAHLERENLPPKKVYLVCADAMLAIVSNLRSPKAIDEAVLLNDVNGFVLRRLQSGC